MQNCIFSSHCTQSVCDKSCPMLAETTYLLERNNISMRNECFHTTTDILDRYDRIVDNAAGKVQTVISTNTIQTADIVTYVGICKYWRGSQLHSTVYNLKYSTYLDVIQKSWGASTDDSAEMMKIWASTAKLLIISGIDYVNFKEYQCQILLSLLQSRSNDSELGTIVVSPSVSSIVGTGPFFSRLTEILSKAVVKK